MKPIGIFGGTFDPVHFGHLRVTIEILENFDLEELRLIPCSTPPIKNAAVASNEQRLEMLRLAIAGQKNVTIDNIEIHREGPSYTFDTLAAIREKLPDVQLYLFLGTDAFLSLNRWHRWHDILELAHIIVIHRPGWDIDSAELANNIDEDIKSILRTRLVHDKTALKKKEAGNIVFFPIRKLDISSSEIRDLIRNGKSPLHLLPQDVLDFIYARNLYSAQGASDQFRDE